MVPVLLRHRRHARLEDTTIRDDAALLAGPGADAGAEWAALVVLGGLGLADLGHVAGDADLALERMPEEEEAGARVRVQVLPFPAPEIGEEGEATPLKPLEEDDARRRGA